MNEVDVIIVGGGLAGLTAAYKIINKEPTLNVLILEASDRVGGRYFTVPLLVNDGKSISFFDLNGHWIHKEQTILLQLLHELDIPIVKTPIDGDVILDYRGRKFVDSRHSLLYFMSLADRFQLTMFILKIEALCHDFKQQRNMDQLVELADLSLKTFVKRHVSSVPAQMIIEYMTLINCGVRIHEINVLFYVFYCVSNKGIVNQILTDVPENYRMRIKCSANNLSDKLSEKIGYNFIQKRQRVLEITSWKNHVNVTTENKSYRCSFVIVAVPPKDILKISFKPQLPSQKIEFLSNMMSRVVTTFAVTYPKGFWKEAGFSGEVYVLDNTFSWGPVDFCSDAGHKNPALTGRIFRDQRISHYASPCYKEEILVQLSEFFGPDALYPTDYCEKSWFQEMCQMECASFGNAQVFQDLSEYFNDRIYWAGAEAAGEWYGNIAGAVQSGIKAALEVLYEIRPSTLTTDDMLILTPTLNYKRRPSRHHEDTMYKFLKYGPIYVPIALVILFIIWRVTR